MLSKKPRLEENLDKKTSPDLLPKSSSKGSHQNLFLPFRTIGIVTSGIPFQIQKLGTEHFVTTSIGNAFHVYNVEKLKLITVSEPTPVPITSLAVFKEYTFTACGPDVYIYKRATQINRLSAKRQDGNFIQMMVFGEYLVALNDANYLILWLYSTGEIYTVIEFNAASFSATYFLHPHTYLNKILVGSSQGQMQLWNIKTNQLIYSFASFSSPITVLSQSPVIDVVGVGLQSGKILLHHLKMDEEICAFNQHSRVTAITFRSDEHAVMATANEHGDIAVWDLSKRSLMHQVKNAHRAALNSMEFLVGQPILMTAALDNSIKQFLFDSPESVPRLLKSRSGHTQPPSMLRFYDEHGRYLLTTSKDRALRLVCVERDAEHVEFSQGSIAKKSRIFKVAEDVLRLSPILNIASNPLQQRDWDPIITCHSDDLRAHTWSFENRCLSHKLDEHPLTCTDNGQVTAVTISSCGHFCVLGSSRGGINLYNMQSGLLRQTYSGHTAPVTGLFMTRLSLIVSIALDKTLHAWNAKDSKPTLTIPFSTPLTHLIGHLDTELMAVVSDDLCLRVLDLTTQKVVREFWGHAHQITDVCFSPDGRWLVSTSLDCTMKTWDMPSGALVDSVRFKKAPTSVAFSPDHGFLATSHVGLIGICLWTNRAQFSHVVLRPLTESEGDSAVEWPSSGIQDSALPDTSEVLAPLLEEEYTTPEQLTEQMISLSLQPRSTWLTLINLETIKTRNKPKQPVEQPKQAPFFLPTTAGVVPSFAKPDSDEDTVMDSKEKSKTADPSSTFLSSPFTKLLFNCSESQDYTSFLSMLESMPPSQLDFELRLLHEAQYTAFLESMLQHLQSKRAFELGQSWLHVFLEHHSEPISRSPSTLHVLQQVLQAHQKEWKRIEQQLNYCQCLLDLIRK